MKEKSFIMIKPGFTKYEKEIVERLNQVGKVTKRKKMLLNDKILSAHYAEHVGKSFYENLCNYMKSGEVIGFQVEGETGLIGKIREMVGATKDPAVGTIRHDFGIGEVTRNVIHASDSKESGEAECARMFGNTKNCVKKRQVFTRNGLPR